MQNCEENDTQDADQMGPTRFGLLSNGGHRPEGDNN